MNIFGRLKLYFKVLTVFRPYFRNIKKQGRFLEIVNEETDPKIVSIYEEITLLPPKKYKKDKAKYGAFSEKVAEHNKEVGRIREAVMWWNLETFIKNPNHTDKEFFSECLEVADLLKKYRITEKSYSSFLSGIEKVRIGYEEICHQYDLLCQHRELFAFSEDEYVDRERQRETASKSADLLKKITFKEYLSEAFERHTNLDEAVKKHNQEYFERAKKDQLFDDINGRFLDDEQRKAVLTDEKSVLVVAGAGSGKTLTICGKVEYLLKKKGVNPNDILLLSYSKKSADDLQKKVSAIDQRLTVGTFHKIGLDILKDARNHTFMVEDQYKAIIEAYFREEMKNRPHMLQTILMYYGLYLSTMKHDKEYENEGDLFEDLKSLDFTTLKDQLLTLSNNVASKETLKKELVKSFEEMAIANWYFINGIKYTYEAPYEKDVSTLDKRQYMPDFKLKDYPIYHEHYGVDKDGKASQYAGEEAIQYVNSMIWKRGIHKVYQTDCIETYSYEFEDGTVFEKLESQLKERGVEFHPLPDEEILNALNSVYETYSFKSFINLVRSFLSLYKASYRDNSGFEKLKSSPFKNAYEKHRASLFLDIVKDIYDYYIAYLAKEGKIDFDDMILQSTEELNNCKGYKYKYIIVDEFQDISVSRMKFLKRLILQGDSRLFAVGDDWQAIYRFSGCDLSIFLEFEKYFGDSAITMITTTHRNSQELQDIAGPFIKKNPEQYDKKINSAKHLANPVQIMYYTGRKKYEPFLDVLSDISRREEKANVLVLGRNNRDLEDIMLDNRIRIDYKASSETKTVLKCSFFPDINLTYSTVHGSKGLEEDYVILLNANDDRIGFPNKMEDDELLDLVLSHKSEYDYAEERRLWYVALTRTRSYTYIIANEYYPSIFLEEIKDQCAVLNGKHTEEEKRTDISCPRCKKGRLVLRINESNGKEFYGCSNYPYCDYTIDDAKAVLRNKRCPSCGDFMILRKGKYGPFYGCHNFPRCNHKEKG